LHWLKTKQSALLDDLKGTALEKFVSMIIYGNANLFQRILSFYANSENKLKSFYRSQRIRQRYRIVFEENAKSLKGFTENAAIL
jgi:hypothetical protein